MKRFSKCPLLICLLVSAAFLTMIGNEYADTAYASYQEKLSYRPALAAVFWGIKDGVFFWEEPMTQTMAESRPSKTQDLDDLAEENNSENNLSETAMEKISDESFGDKQPQASISENDFPKQSISGNELPWQEEKKQGISENELATEGISENGLPVQGISENELPVQEEILSFGPVEESYFDDALFIGDSRTQGLYEYGKLEEHAEFYCRTSLTVFDLFEKNKAFIKTDDETLTLTEALGRKQFKKIYLMLGINELGTGTPESFLKSYSAAVENIRLLQPDAIIYVQAIMRVAGKKNETDLIYNNKNINIRNEMIRTLADQKHIFYLDVNDVLCDENGNLFDDWTYDQIHLKAKYYEIWKAYLMENGISKKFFK